MIALVPAPAAGSGSPAQWADELGRHVLAGGPLWPVITERQDEHRG